MDKKNIVSLHGSYFVNNYGDVLLINIFHDWIKESFPTVQVNLPLVNKKKILELPEPTSTGLINLLRSDCLVYSGGGYFGEQPKNKGRWSVRNFFRHAIIGILAIIFRIPIAIIGVEVGPLSKSWFRCVVLKIVRRSKIVVVRNQESDVFLRKYGINNAMITADAVLALNQQYTKDHLEPQTSNYIVLHLPGYKHSKEALDYFVTSLCNVMRTIDIALTLTFVEDTPNQYGPHYKTLFSIIEQNGFEYKVVRYSGIHEVLNTIKSSRAVITTKLHVGITAAAYNRKVFSIYAHPKTLRFHSQIGNQAYCLSLNQLNESFNITPRIMEFFESRSPVLSESVLSSAIRNRIVLESFIQSCLK
jgi:polysaccharide pyruvyl transferase WcaK-like protein